MKTKIFIIFSIIILLLGVMIPKVIAYFTVYTEAKGSLELDLTIPTTVIHQEINENSRNITIENIGEVACYVRIKMFLLPENEVQIKNNDNWRYNSEDGYWYYNKILEGKSTSEKLEIEMKKSNSKVIIVSETTDVMYADGNSYADWEGVIEDILGY